MQQSRWQKIVRIASYMLLAAASIFMVLSGLILAIFTPLWILSGDGTGGWGGWAPVLRTQDIILLIFGAYQMFAALFAVCIFVTQREAKTCVAVGAVGIVFAVAVTFGLLNRNEALLIGLPFVVYTLSAYILTSPLTNSAK